MHLSYSRHPRWGYGGGEAAPVPEEVWRACGPARPPQWDDNSPDAGGTDAGGFGGLHARQEPFFLHWARALPAPNGEKDDLGQ